VREAQWDPNEQRAITFVMSHLAGGSIHDALLEDCRFSLHESIAITVDALDAVGYVHRTFGAVHRDTKPGNVLLDGGRTRGYLTDFGSAATMDEQGQQRRCSARTTIGLLKLARRAGSALTLTSTGSA
jgi:serine/threonine protein kinase